MNSTTRTPPHVLILGSGIAGLSCALQFIENAQSDIRVTVLTKSEATEGATRYAQGGIASVWSKDDTFEAHVQDTLVAGAGLCSEPIVEICVREGPARVRELIDWGVEFTRSSQQTTDPAETFDLHREGGHGNRRILHADDLTGLAIEKALLARVALNPRISLLEDFCAIDLIHARKITKEPLTKDRCLGVYALNTRTGKIETIAADSVVLATGGAGKAYLYTTNPDTSTGDGIAMAYRAGAKIANMEFIQFHPTCLYHPVAKTFLITEALRGEGAVLRNGDGESFMESYDERGSLAPRDIVARSIDMEMKRTGQKHVWLDCTSLGEHELKTKFPNIYETCLKLGLRMEKDFLPVVPATHYTCGGVRVNEWGESSLPGLYALGEASSTGLHGANRLASNSLLEAVVFAHRVAKHAHERLKHPLVEIELPPSLPSWETGRAVELEEQIDIAATWQEIRQTLWNYVGIVRSDRRLERAQKRLAIIREEVNEYYWTYLLTKDLIELRNLITVAELVVRSAQMRKESRGLHYTVDYPTVDDEWSKVDTVL